MTYDPQDIHVNDPVWREEVLVTRGNRCLYFVKYDDDTRYTVMDENGFGTAHMWRGDIEGIADFQALADLFDEVYPADDNDPDEGGNAA